jgi:polyisoprenoid-binding protein YceI
MSSALATVAIPGYLAGTWKADPAHSEVAFSGRHLMISNTRGRFTGYDVTIVTGEDPLLSSVSAAIDLATVDTRLKMRDDHLR